MKIRTIAITIFSLNLLSILLSLFLFRDHSFAYPSLVLAYTLGLKHAMDADHIAAIDNVTRILVDKNQDPSAVGMFFSIGHSTVVLVSVLVVILSVNSVDYSGYGNVSKIIGPAVSALFLIIVGIFNSVSLYYLIKAYKSSNRNRTVSKSSTGSNSLSNLPNTISYEEVEKEKQIVSGGLMYRSLSRLFKTIDKPWKMYPIGLLFGLGFDTASEIILLSLSVTQIQKGIPIATILCFPLLFTCAMSLVDTIDSTLMSYVYSISNDDEEKRTKYRIVITFISIVLAFTVSLFQILSLIEALTLGDSTERIWFWSVVDYIEEIFPFIGIGVSILFLMTLFGFIIFWSWNGNRIDKEKDIDGDIQRDLSGYGDHTVDEKD